MSDRPRPMAWWPFSLGLNWFLSALSIIITGRGEVCFGMGIGFALGAAGVLLSTRTKAAPEA